MDSCKQLQHRWFSISVIIDSTFTDLILVPVIPC